MRSMALVLALTVGCSDAVTTGLDAARTDAPVGDIAAAITDATDVTDATGAPPPWTALSSMRGVAAGTDFTCAWGDGPTVGVWCWGNGFAGMLGNGGTALARTATRVRLPVRVTAVGCGIVHACALDDLGGVECWGANGPGLLGDGTLLQRSVPVAVGVPAMRGLALTGGSSCAVAVGPPARVWCWGEPALRGLGLDAGVPGTVPARVPGAVADPGVTAMAAGSAHTCVARGDGTVWCWGQNPHGQLGDGTRTDRAVPTAVAGLTDAVTVWAGSQSTCARRQGGRVACWGANGSGQLGDGTVTDRTVPTDFTGPPGLTAVVLGDTHGCGLTPEGGVLCWGEDASGQLGDDGSFGRTTPAAVPGLGVAVSLAAGAYHTCAVTADGGVYCWGRGTVGQLGDGGREIQRHPVQVLRAR